MKIVATGAALASLYIFICLFGTSQAAAAAECVIDDDCQPAVNGSACIDGRCACPETRPLQVNATRLNASFCMAERNETGGACTFDQQCAYANGMCSSEGQCACKPRFQEKEGQCAKNSLIPIAVGVGIGVAVFGTLLLYCWLSRRKRE